MKKLYCLISIITFIQPIISQDFEYRINPRTLKFDLVRSIISIQNISSTTIKPHIGIDFFNQSIATPLSINDTIHLSNATKTLYTTGYYHTVLWTLSNDTLISTITGHYLISIRLSVRSVGGGGEYKLIYKINDSKRIVVGEETTGSSQLKSIQTQSMLDINAGDKLWFELVNITSSNDVNIEGLSITITIIHQT